MTKEHIIREIKRTAEANGGAALGTRAFLKEAGIRESDWKGKYWVRWNEAVEEAGLAANAKTEALDEEFLQEKLVELAKAIGRFPTMWDIRMRKRRDNSFPNDNTFKTRWGSKKEWMEKVAEYCRAHSGCDDVLALCQVQARNETPQEDNCEDGVLSDEVGFVYLMRSGGFYKIGRSNAPGRRERELGIQLPEKASLVHQIRTDDPVGIEAYWHRRFASKRKNGEWFDLDGSEIKAFRRRKFM